MFEEKKGQGAGWRGSTAPLRQSHPLIPQENPNHYLENYYKIKREVEAVSDIDNLSHLKEGIPDGLLLEFGVAGGTSTKVLGNHAKKLLRRLYAFDWFHGLPETWGPNPQHTFTTHGVVPKKGIPRNVYFIVGLFQDTLEPFLAEHPEPVAFVHMDCDLYESAAYILERLECRLQPGTVIAFDELIDYHENLEETDYGHWKNGEYRAFFELTERRPNLTWRCIGRGAPWQIAIEILSV